MHGVIAQELLKGVGLPEELLRAILAHNYMNAPERHGKMEHALVAADSMAGPIIACAMVKGKRLGNVTEETVKNAFKKKGFAAGSKRDMIMECERAGIPFGKFVEISLGALKEVAGKLEL